MTRMLPFPLIGNLKSHLFLFVRHKIIDYEWNIQYNIIVRRIINKREQKL